MKSKNQDSASYQKLTAALKRQNKGATAADLVARTALPLETVRELLPLAADEYSGRLEVTESGEILYSFPQGFTSRYRGAGAAFRKFLRALGKGAAAAGKLAFKVWIMVMLVGYFALFMLLALATLMLSVAASSSGNGRGRRRGGDGGMFFVSGIFNTIIRIWFYSELLKPRAYRDAAATEKKPKGRPLYKAIFSFVFGDGDPNALWEEQEKKAVIAYIQARSGVISVAEYAALSGLSYQDADRAITAYCAEFGGVPEVTQGGAIVYRFDELLRRADTRDRSFGALSGPLKRLTDFSSNEKKLNTGFSLINAVNILFGGYFLYNTLTLGQIVSQKQITGFNYFYAVVYTLFAEVLRNPLGAITIGLGFVPLAFSVLFWAIPALRFANVKKANDAIKMENFRKTAYARFWESPLGINPAEIAPTAPECLPANPAKARDQAIKEAAAQWPVEVEAGGAGELRYSFPGMAAEKRELEAFRAGVDRSAGDLGKTVFDSDA